MAFAYYASKISDNIAVTPEGYLCAKDAVLGRTGSQKYLVSELPKEALDEMGFDTSDPNAGIDVYRPDDEVFSKQAISTMEGKPITDNHPPNNAFVNTSNIKDLQKGHVQNVHKGDEPLDSGEWPLVGDLIITHPELIQKVKDGLRELSCGYDYELQNQDGRLTQTNIKHNHVAVVPKGRAGAEARIADAEPQVEPDLTAKVGLLQKALDQMTELQHAFHTLLKDKGYDVGEWEGTPAFPNKDFNAQAKPKEFSATAKAADSKPLARESANQKEEPMATKEKEKVTDRFRHILGLGFKAFAADAAPEDVAEAAEEMGKKGEDGIEEGVEATPRNQPMGDRRKADDKRADDRRADDRRADDHKADDGRMDDRRADDRRMDDRRADDHRTDDRARFHKMLDRMLDMEEQEKEEGRVDDADIAELRDLLDNYLGEEQQEPEHQDDELPEDESNIGEGETELEQMTEAQDRKADDHKGKDARARDQRAEFLEPIPDPAERRAHDASEYNFLKRIKPIIARSNDSALVKEYNARIRKFNKSRAASGGGYGEFAAAASARDEERMKKEDPTAGLQAAYDALHAKMKETK